VSLDEFFRVPAYIPFVQAPLATVSVAKLEMRLDVTLPLALLQLLEFQNGGYLRRSHCSNGLGPVEYIAGIGDKFPSLERGAHWNALRERIREDDLTCDLELSRLLPLYNDGHYAYCLDYRQTVEEPSVVCMNVDYISVVGVVATDFQAFMADLQPVDPRPAVGIATSLSMEEVAALLGRTLGAEFADRGVETYGFRAFASTSKAEAAAAWLSENRVRRGFARSEDAGSGDLDARWGDYVYRFPRHADCKFILEVGSRVEEVMSLELKGLSLGMIEIDG